VEEKVTVDVHKIYVALSQKYGWIPSEIKEMKLNQILYLRRNK